MEGSGPTTHHSTAPSSLKEDVDTARDIAMSALNNARFGKMLEWISDPRSSEAIMLMRRMEGAGADYGTAAARYEENAR